MRKCRVICLSEAPFVDRLRYPLLEFDELNFEWCDLDHFAIDGDLYLCPSFFITDLLYKVNSPIMTYGDGDDMDSCFLAGAAEYLRNVFSMSELVARSKKVLGVQGIYFTWGVVHIGESTVSVDRLNLDLPMQAALLFKCLLRNCGRPILREHLKLVIGMRNLHSRLVDVQISNIRKQLKPFSAGIGCDIIVSHSRKGYSIIK